MNQSNITGPVVTFVQYVVYRAGGPGIIVREARRRNHTLSRAALRAPKGAFGVQQFDAPAIKTAHGLQPDPAQPRCNVGPAYVIGRHRRLARFAH